MSRKRRKSSNVLRAALDDSDDPREIGGTGAVNHTQLDSLPDETLQLIFAGLPFPSRQYAALVCRRWNDLLLDAPFWRAVRPGQSLSEVLQASGPGDTLICPPGMYQETLLVDKPVRLVAQGHWDWQRRKMELLRNSHHHRLHFDHQQQQLLQQLQQREAQRQQQQEQAFHQPHDTGNHQMPQYQLLPWAASAPPAGLDAGLLAPGPSLRDRTPRQTPGSRQQQERQQQQRGQQQGLREQSVAPMWQSRALGSGGNPAPGLQPGAGAGDGGGTAAAGPSSERAPAPSVTVLSLRPPVVVMDSRCCFVGFEFHTSTAHNEVSICCFGPNAPVARFERCTFSGLTGLRVPYSKGSDTRLEMYDCILIGTTQTLAAVQMDAGQLLLVRCAIQNNAVGVEVGPDALARLLDCELRWCGSALVADGCLAMQGCRLWGNTKLGNVSTEARLAEAQRHTEAQIAAAAQAPGQQRDQQQQRREQAAGFRQRNRGGRATVSRNGAASEFAATGGSIGARAGSSAAAAAAAAAAATAPVAPAAPVDPGGRLAAVAAEQWAEVAEAFAAQRQLVRLVGCEVAPPQLIMRAGLHKEVRRRARQLVRQVYGAPDDDQFPEWEVLAHSDLDSDLDEEDSSVSSDLEDEEESDLDLDLDAGEDPLDAADDPDLDESGGSGSSDSDSDSSEDLPDSMSVSGSDGTSQSSGSGSESDSAASGSGSESSGSSSSSSSNPGSEDGEEGDSGSGSGGSSFQSSDSDSDSDSSPLGSGERELASGPESGGSGGDSNGHVGARGSNENVRPAMAADAGGVDGLDSGEGSSTASSNSSDDDSDSEDSDSKDSSSEDGSSDDTNSSGSGDDSDSEDSSSSSSENSGGSEGSSSDSSSSSSNAGTSDSGGQEL